MMRIMGVLAVLVLAFAAAGDVLLLNNGGTLEGQILKEDDKEVTIRTALGVVVMPRKDIAGIERKPFTDPNAAKANHATGARGRLPETKGILRMLRASPWTKGGGVRQVPATVLKSGLYKDVPYCSYRAGVDYEVDIYGDPAAPVAIEVGLHNMRTRDEASRKSAIAFLAGLMTDAEDRAVVEKLDRARDSKVREGLTFEVVPQAGGATYDAWWVRVYDDRTLDLERAGEEEIGKISVLRGREGYWTPPPQYTRRGKLKPPPPGGDPWTGDEMQLARETGQKRREMLRVYVREFLRAEGKYRPVGEKDE